MQTKMFRSVTSLIVVTALLLLSCGPTAAPAPASTTPAPGTAAPAPVAPTPAPTPAAPPPLTASTEKPKYGGTINVVRPSVTELFDIAVAPG